MTELKTLKDLYPYMEDTNGKYIKQSLLKAEAVKWYKRHNRISKSMKPYLVQEFIKHFFNLTSEDLK